MKSYLISLTIIGIASLGMAWMPTITQRLRISYSILYVLIGVLLYSLVDALPWPNPIWEEAYGKYSVNPSCPSENTGLSKKS
jgi:hypothetical protein